VIAISRLIDADYLIEFDNSSVGEEEHFEFRHIIEALTDWQVYLQILVYMSIIGPCKLLSFTAFSRY
jgi:hypothetical protein